jgi:glycosyltransferase involved in cell wall biosynthesis
MKVAITADWLNQFGGAERVLIELRRLFPDAPIYTTVHVPEALPEEMQGWDVRTSFLQRIPFARRRHQPFLPLMPLAFEQFDLSGYDLVLTTSSACAKGVITPAETLNVCYCYTPSRYLWDLYHEYTSHLRSRFLIAPVAHWMRMWDRAAADRVDHFLAISSEVSTRIRKHYRRDAEIVYPPVDVDRVRPDHRPADDFYLVVSRLVAYKRIDLAIGAANRLRFPLVVVGDGPERERLESMAGPTVRFLGRKSDAEVAELYARCRGFIFAGLEDFGIAPVEAQAAGRPVIAFGRGGASETVVDGETGVHFHEQSVDAVVEAVLRAEAQSFSVEDCRRNAEKYSRESFRRSLCASLAAKLAEAGHDASALPVLRESAMTSMPRRSSAASFSS